GHVDACGKCHQRVRVLDDRVSFGVFHFLVAVAADAVELQQPVSESLRGRYLAGADVVRLGVPGNDGLRTCSAGRCADTQDFLECSVAMLGAERTANRIAVSEYVRCERDERIDGIEALGCAALRSEPRVDERVAEPVGKRVGKQSRKAVKGDSWQRWED